MHFPIVTCKYWKMTLLNQNKSLIEMKEITHSSLWCDENAGIKSSVSGTTLLTPLCTTPFLADLPVIPTSKDKDRLINRG